LEQFRFTDTTNLRFDNPTIECSSTSEFDGIFKVNVKGSSAGQLAAQIKARGIRPFALNNGQTITVNICNDECSPDDFTAAAAEAKPWINKTSGIVIAVTVVTVMLAGVVLLVVILIRYRR
jgi:hypothetical protein